jgi:hypothetical protein
VKASTWNTRTWLPMILTPAASIVATRRDWPLAILRRFFDSLRRKPWGGPERT